MAWYALAAVSAYSGKGSEASASAGAGVGGWRAGDVGKAGRRCVDGGQEVDVWQEVDGRQGLDSGQELDRLHIKLSSQNSVVVSPQVTPKATVAGFELCS